MMNQTACPFEGETVQIGDISRINVVLVNTISPYYLVRYQGPLAINVLAAYVQQRAQNASVHRIDMQENFERISADGLLSVHESFKKTVDDTAREVCDVVQVGCPTIVGISVKWATVEVAQGIIDQVRVGCGEKVLFVLGNIGSTFGYEELLKLPSFKAVLAVVGEGEDALISIANRAAENAERFTDTSLYKDIPNVATNVDGVPTLESTARVDLEQYPTGLYGKAEDVYDKSWGVHCVETSRGCPWGHCTFCSVNGQFGGNKNSGWVPFPVESVLANMRILVDNGVRNLDIKDSEFFGPVRLIGGRDPFDATMARAQNFAQGMRAINDGLDTGDKATIHHISARVDTIYKAGENVKNIVREETYRMLKEAGLRGVYLGIESGSQSQLRRFGKGVTPEENKQAIEIMRRLGFEIEVGFIFFDYLATMRELKENVDFICETRLYGNDSRILGSLRVQEGSPYIEMMRRKGLLGSKHDDFLGYRASFLHPDVEALEKIFIKWEKGTVKLVRLIPMHFRLEVQKMDFMLMKELVNDFLESGGTNSGAILNRYHAERRELLNKIREDVGVQDMNLGNPQLLETYLQIAESASED